MKAKKRARATKKVTAARRHSRRAVTATRKRSPKTVQQLSRDEMLLQLDQRTKSLLNMSATDFLQRAREGKLPATADVTYLKTLAGVI